MGRNGIRTEYGEDGRLSRMLDVNGEALALEYDLDNSVQTVRDIYGNPTTYVYDSRGNVLTEVDPVGLQTVRTYDERNNVLTETMITAESGPEGWTTTYTYDGQNNQLSETDSLGNTRYYTYNSRGQVLTTTDALGNTVTSDYSPTGKLLSTTDVNGNTTQYTNDLQGNIRAISTSDNTTTFDYYSDGNVKSLEDSLGNKGTYEYTPNGDLTQEILTIQAPDGTEPEIITEWVYDQEGNLKTQTQGDRQVDYDYDSNGNLISSTNDGQTTIYRYDDKGQLVETLYPDDTPADDSDNPRTITIYDRGGRERATIDQNGNVTHYEYDAVGRLTKTIYPDDTTNQVEQLIAAIAPDKTIATIDWTKGITYPDATPAYVSSNAYTGTEYTQDGRIKAEFDSEGNRTEYQYDALGRQTQIRTDAENWVEYTYDVSGNRRTETFHAEGTSWTNTYDESGRLVSFTDPRNQTTTYEYHPGGQLKTVVDPNQGRTSYEYTEEGQLKSITDALNQTTTYVYDDPEGRLTSVTLPDTTQQSTYTYDDANNAVTIKDFNGDEIKYVYNDAGTLIRKELLASGTIITYNSDDTARTETITRGTESTVYTYDEAGRLTARKDPDGPYTPDGNSIEYVYTDNSMTVKTPNREMTTVYNDDGTIQSVTTVHGSETETTSYEYENGQLTKTLFPNGTAEVITYDDLGRIDEIKTVEVDVQGNELNTLSSYDYEVDAAGNRKQVEDHNGRIVTYQYDELNRVTEEKVTQNPQNPSEVGRTITYTYDAVGNLEYKADTVAGDTDYVYNALNQLISSTFGGETTTYTYDSNGSLKTRTVGNTVTTYHWENDGENRLKGVTVTENGVPVTTIEYEYNDQGIRVGKTVNGDETRYLIDELQPYAQVIEQYDGETDALEVAYTYGEDLIAQVENGETSYYHVDGLGSTRLLTNEAGVAVETFTYDAYGNLIAGDGTAADYLFAGEQRDIETGLDYLRARYYDPTLGRFVSADAYFGTLDDPMSLHKYQYAHANPVVNTDPSGYFSIQDLIASRVVQNILSGLRTIGLTSAKIKLLGSAIVNGSLFGGFLGGLVGAYKGALNGINSSFSKGLTVEEGLIRGALEGAFDGAVRGSILGGVGAGIAALVGPGLAATLGNVGGGTITGATSSAGGELSFKLFNYATGREEKFELYAFVSDIALAAGFGAIGGALFIRAGQAPPSNTQQISHWQPKRYPVTPNSQLRDGDWVMIGGKGFINYFLSGIYAKFYPYRNAFTTKVSGETLRYPDGFLDAWKGLIGQRIYTSP